MPGAEDRIYDKISDITISMKGTDYLEMPELISTEYKVYLDEIEKAKYEALRDELVLQLPGGEITASNAATLSGKLSQLSNGAIYSDDGDVNIFHERKLDALEDLIEAANGRPVLVAYWFKHDLRRISERLSNLGIDFQQLDSDASIKKWNSGQLQVGLIHPASAGHGLNLQSGGNILVWFGITWSLELYQQTVARLWRQGQTEGTVSVIHIVNIPCKHPGCAALIPHGQMYCEEHKPLHTKDRAHAAERGYGAKWQRERRKFLEGNPFCVKCYEEGHITMATVVDHIKPHRGDQKLFWDRSNWQPLCEHHHNVKTMTEDRFKEYRF